jgi:hypothetical protein
MSYKSHKSPISSLLEVLDGWRKAGNKSRETAAEEIVCAHERIDGPARTGVFFEPRTTDVFKRMHTNAARFFRWMDDESKDTNLLSVNLLPSVLAALPEDARIHWLNDYLRPLGLCVRDVDQAENATPDMNRLLCGVLKETGEAVQSMAESAANPTGSNIAKTVKELADAERTIHDARMQLEPAMSAPAILKAVRAA